MAWKQVYCDEGIGSERGWAEKLGVYFPDGYARSGRYRIVVEEEVSECCEKWRGQDVCTRALMVSYPKYEKYVIGARCVPTFCPECGKRL